MIVFGAVKAVLRGISLLTGNAEDIKSRDGAALVNPTDFCPSSYSPDMTMNGTAQGVALATGARKLHIVNLGATTEAIRFAFGTSELDAEGNLTHSTNRATTGMYIPALVDSAGGALFVSVPSLATHFAVENAVAGDTQVVSITQGV